jgi:hypothetical protein
MKIRSYLELQKQYNTLELKYETLKDQVKEDCFKSLLKVLSEQNDVERLRTENKKLRMKIKELKANNQN